MSHPQIAPLDAGTLPLYGTRLIEASAGTGKTYTIANLYLRILLGHGEANSRHVTPLTVDQILVVTFTEAATEELRDRIRARIHDTRLAFIDGHSTDPFIARLINDLDNIMGKDYCTALLLAAEQQMDEAAIFTIHGFCQRMLKQHAFESGTLFSSELVKDLSPLLQTSVADYWRKQFYPLDKPLASLVKHLWKTPADLLIAVRQWIGMTELTLQDHDLPGSMTEFQQHYVEPALELKMLWHTDQAAIEDQLKTCGLKKNSKTYKRMAAINDFLESDGLVPPLKNPAGWEAFSTDFLNNSLTKNGSLPSHPVFRKIDAFVQQPVDLKTAFQAMVIRDAIGFIRAQLSRLKEQHHQLSFDDLLANLDRALSNGSEPETETSLADAIREQFRIAMIDEFQDTDPQQYRIFSRIYGDTRDGDAGLFMIGDPKQAIYAFRGADIFTYMKAREQVNSHYTLGTNWRSSASMVATVNTLFQQADSPFIYNDSIPFEPVQSAPGSGDKHLQDPLYNDPKAAPSLKLWLQESPDSSTINSETYLDTLGQATATEINRLLTAADQQQCRIHKLDQEAPLKPGDIAILVRTGSQARRVRKALANQNIASIFLSDKSSVFQSQEAKDLERVLAACLHPTHERSIRAALATPLLQLDAPSLDALNHDEQVWESAVEEFSDYQSTWLETGVLPMIRTLVQRRRLAEQLLAGDNGERRLTDLLHLGELLATASQDQESPSALLRWFSRQLTNPNPEADDQQLHLESQRNLVKVITIHKSKGLEYNVVFVPFVCHFRKAGAPLYHDPDTGQSTLALTGGEQALEQAEQERLAEDLRLLYVALTRSVYRCYLGMAPFKSGKASRDGKTDLHYTAIGYLLNNGQELNAQTLRERLESLAELSPAIEVSSPPGAEFPPYQPIDTSSPDLAAREFRGTIERNWWMTSYSAIARTAISHNVLTKTQAKPMDSPVDSSLESPGHDLEVLQENQPEALPEATQEDHSLFAFPKGARPGTFMHSLFERMDLDQARAGHLTEFIQQQLLQEGYEAHWTEALEAMLTDCLKAPLDGQSMKLLSIAESARKVEMEFYLPISRLSANALNHWIARHDPLSARAGTLDFQQLRGMLKGFIDLTFEYQGRWYVLDYKSNWLGASLEDYSRTQMEQVMIDHRYDLQYQIYSLAIHRLLRQRLPDYDYDRHFGGVIYLFLRGVRADSPEPFGIYNHRPSRTLIEGLDRLFKGEEPREEPEQTVPGHQQGSAQQEMDL